MQAWTEEALDKVDPKVGCLYFTDCFKDPSTFNFVFVGNIDTEKAIPLIMKYLVRITSWHLTSRLPPTATFIVLRGVCVCLIYFYKW